MRPAPPQGHPTVRGDQRRRLAPGDQNPAVLRHLGEFWAREGLESGPACFASGRRRLVGPVRVPRNLGGDVGVRRRVGAIAPEIQPQDQIVVVGERLHNDGNHLPWPHHLRRRCDDRRGSDPRRQRREVGTCHSKKSDTDQQLFLRTLCLCQHHDLTAHLRSMMLPAGDHNDYRRSSFQRSALHRGRSGPGTRRATYHTLDLGIRLPASRLGRPTASRCAHPHSGEQWA